MIFNEVTKRLFDSAVKKLQGNIDNIQTISRATLSQAGWYRVAEYSNGTTINCNSCFIAVRKTSSQSESALLRLEATDNKKVFSIVSIASDMYHDFTKIRYTRTSTNSYIEVYVARSTTLGWFATVLDVSNSAGTWKALNFIPTSEIVDGVTVTTTYDIPANASPVTDLELDGRTLFKTQATGTDLNNCVKTGIYGFVGTATDYVNTPSETAHNGTLFVTETSAGNIVQRYYTLNLNRTFERGRIGGSWQPWRKVTTEYDLTTALANYIPRSGGYFTGETGIGDSNTASNYTFGYRANGHYLGHQLLSYGDFRLVDLGNMDKIYDSVKGGSGRVNTWYGTATGNLPLNGGGQIDSTDVAPVRVNNKGGNAKTLFGYLNNGVLQGYLGFNGKDTPIYQPSGGGEYNLLHTGNSTKIAFTESDAAAPSDNTALWAHL